MTRTLRVAAAQATDHRGDIDSALDVMCQYAALAQSQGARLVCFPECYLQGYILTLRAAQRVAMVLDSPEFYAVLRRLRDFEPVLVFGLIESHEEKLYNTAVVVSRGELLGQYRKHNLLKAERLLFEPGRTFPVFTVEGVTFGVQICYDLNFSEHSTRLTSRGADLIVAPCHNMLPRDVAQRWKHEHNARRRQLAMAAGCWLLSSDVTGARGDSISYGPTALIDPTGHVSAQVPLMQEGLLVQDIELD